MNDDDRHLKPDASTSRRELLGRTVRGPSACAPWRAACRWPC
jgi:hypothetical protein